MSLLEVNQWLEQCEIWPKIQQKPTYFGYRMTKFLELFWLNITNFNVLKKIISKRETLTEKHFKSYSICISIQKFFCGPFFFFIHFGFLRLNFKFFNGYHYNIIYYNDISIQFFLLTIHTEKKCISFNSFKTFNHVYFFSL